MRTVVAALVALAVSIPALACQEKESIQTADLVDRGAVVGKVTSVINYQKGSYIVVKLQKEYVPATFKLEGKKVSAPHLIGRSDRSATYHIAQGLFEGGELVVKTKAVTWSVVKGVKGQRPRGGCGGSGLNVSN